MRFINFMGRLSAGVCVWLGRQAATAQEKRNPKLLFFFFLYSERITFLDALMMIYRKSEFPILTLQLSS